MSRQEELPIGVLIGAARRRIKQAVGQRLRGYRLTPQQFWLFVAIHEMEGLSLRELAERRHIDSPTACRVVMTLTRKGLVRAQGDPKDRRRSSLRLTPRGAETIAQVYPMALELRDAMTRDVPASDLETALRVLQKVMTNMERFETQGHTTRRTA